MKALLELLRKEDGSIGGSDDFQPRRFAPDALTHAGLETRTPRDRYDWDGLKRGMDPKHPQVLFQVTLDGTGAYEDRTLGEQTLPAGKAFVAVIPSAHRYWLPTNSPQWTFFWVMVRHEYVAQRIAERQRATPNGAGTILTVRPDSALVARGVALLKGDFPDRFAEETAVFEFLIAYERHVHAALLGGDSADAAAARDALLAETRARIQERMARPLAVEELAALHDMSRTRFSHYFKAVTGIAPAAYMTQVRLEEVARQLVHTNGTISAIAEATGFADANHLCKVFRRHFHLSPGAFRRQMK